MYLPLELVTVVHAGRKRDVERAWLPRMLFVLDEGQGVPVMKFAPGVSHVVRNAGGMLMVEDRYLQAIRRREASVTVEGKERRYVDLTERLRALDAKPDYVPGEIVRVTDGPFCSFNAVFECDRVHRAQVAVQLFGRSVPVELEFSQFEKL